MSAPKRTLSDIATGVVGFLGVSAIAGILVAVSVTPSIAVSGYAANSGISLFENIPSYLAIEDLPQKSTMYAMNGDQPVLMATFYQDNRESLPWDQISQTAKDAAVAGEDARFYEHGGVDLQGTIRAVVATTTGRDVQGGSSITQQYVKNVLINNGMREAKTLEEKEAAYQAATEVTPDRKLKEMRYAIALEKQYSKDEILQGYLNIAHFGGIVYGIEAAAKYYYGVPNSKLTLAQTASVIAITQEPNSLRLDRPDDPENGAANGYALNKDRRDYILTQMLRYKKITREQFDEAIATVIEPHITPSENGCQTAGTEGSDGFFCDYVTNVIRNEMDDPETPDVNEGDVLLTTGGLEIYTTLDIDVQAASVAAINENVPQAMETVNIGSVAVTVQTGTGRVLAMAQNKKYSQDSSVTSADPTYTAVNYSTDYDYGGSTGFQPGSTYKVFTLGAWLKAGHGLTEGFNGSNRPMYLTSCEGLSGTWSGKNDDKNGANNAVQATKLSVNSAFIAMAQKLNLCDIKAVAQAFGIHRADGNELQMHPADVIGTQEVAPLSMAAAYAGIANDGLFCTPVAIDRIVKADGTEVTPPQTKCSQAVDPQIAYAMQYAMQAPFTSGGTAVNSRTGTDVPHIGKTGTTDAAVATWMDGASTQAATVVWVGNVEGFQSMRRLWLPSGQAAQARHRIWPRIMRVIDEKYGGEAFTAPDASAFRDVKVAVPNVAGMSLEAAQQAIEAADFVFEYAGEVDSSLPAGQVTGSDPSGEASLGSTIRVNTSNGQGAIVPNVVGLTVQQAQTALVQAGFKVKVDGGADSAWTVSAQNPGANATAKKGDTITIAATRPDDADPGRGDDEQPGGAGGDRG
ncbi:transglycosylase domain-containing protein [Agromyces seonyuensis]|uniref:PASTA domain-containing protein n=1 Tax=Agromyces seonyuensis TaxID=2662446 RepID=A0A6I4NZR4_9MICO|nr:transglycosylase domain-containing protein [Agromyces seonyuensis]MWB98732.1 PASTA domain-containing protein [Agromyces seonyuensis]